jgi:protoheme IX farnesyltransferase
LSYTIALVLVSLLPPLLLGKGPIYALGAGAGGAWFLWKSVALYRNPTPQAAIQNFLASLVQLGLLVAAVVLDATLG